MNGGPLFVNTMVTRLLNAAQTVVEARHHLRQVMFDNIRKHHGFTKEFRREHYVREEPWPDALDHADMRLDDELDKLGRAINVMKQVEGG